MGNLASIPSILKKPLFTGERVIALSAGSYSIRAALLQVQAGRTRTLREIRILPDQQGLTTAARRREALQESLREFGDFPIILCIPQHCALSQVIEYEASGAADEDDPIEERVHELGGLSGGRMVTAFSSLVPFETYMVPTWVTVSQEDEILSRMTSLGLEPDDLCGVAANGDALIARLRGVAVSDETTVLCDVGHDGTTVVILDEGQGVFAGTLPLGGRAFTESLADDLKVTPFEAEDLKHNKGFSEATSPSLTRASDQWLKDLMRVLTDWAQDHPVFREQFNNGLPIYLTGGGAELKGWAEHLNKDSHHEFALFDFSVDLTQETTHPTLEGAALMATRQTPQNNILLPEVIAATLSKENAWHWVQSLSLVLLLAASIAMTAASSYLNEQIEIDINAQELTYSAITRITTAREARNDVLTGQQFFQPLLAAQHQTVHYLDALEAIQNAASSNAWWYVQISDQPTYFNHRNPTNTTTTNLVAAPSVAYGLIAEVCMARDEDKMREDLSILASRLAKIPNVFRVDTINHHRQYSLAYTNVVVPERHFGLSIELYPHPFHMAPPVEEEEPKEEAAISRPRRNPSTVPPAP